MLTFSLPIMAQKSTFTGKVTKNQKTDTLLMYVQGIEREALDTISLDKKGRFSISYDIPQMTEGMVFVKSGNADPSNGFCVLLQPGKTINADITISPFKVKYSGEDALKSEYANMYYKNVTLSTVLVPDTIAVKCASFIDAKKYINDIIGSMEAVVGKIDDKAFASQAQAALDDQRQSALVGYGICREKMGHTLKNDSEFMDFIGNIDCNDTLQVTKIYNYLEWYYAANPGLYTPMSADGAKIKYLAEYTSNQEVRNKVANLYLMNILFLAQWGMDTASSDLKDLYEQYLNVCTDTTYYSFVKENLKTMAAQAPGQEAIDFTLEDMDGKQSTFISLLGNGKVTYVDFWATWCGPCKKEIPHFAKLAAEYQSKNIRMVSISIDSDKKAWKAKVNEDKPEWEQYIVPDLQNCPGLTGYNINSIPRFMLFDADGKLFKSAAPRPSDPEIKVLIDNMIK